MRSVSNFFGYLFLTLVIIMWAGTAFALAPVVTAGDTLAYTEGDVAKVIDIGVLVSDPDSFFLSSATVSISANYQNGQDMLSFTSVGGISGSFNAVSGVLTLTGNTFVANYQAVLRSVTYANTSESPVGGSRTISFMVNDGVDDSPAAFSTVTVTAVNDAPAVTAGGTLAYTEGDGAAAIDSGILVSDVDGTTMVSATVAISTNYQSGEDILAFSNTPKISGSFNATTGILTLTGSDTLNKYQSALRSVTYENTSLNPVVLNRTISFVVDDGTDPSAPATSTIALSGENDVPVVTAGGTLAYTEGDGAVVVDGSVLVNDPDNTDLSGATVTISANYQNGQDALSFTPSGGITGSFNAVSGVLTLFGTSLVGNYQTALRSVTYANTSENPVEGGRTISFVVTDDVESSAPVTSTVTVTAVNNAPTVTAGGILAYTEGDGAVAIDNGILVSDPDSTDLSGATVTISANYQNGEDVLSFTPVGGIIGSFDAAGGVLTLSGTSTTANYQDALRIVSYENTSDTPLEASRTISIMVTDGVESSTPVTSTVNLFAGNDAPVITGQVVLPMRTEEEVPLILNLTDIVATDADNTYPTGFTLVVQDGINYTHSGTTVTPVLNFSGALTVNVQVDDGSGAPNALSDRFGLSVTVDPIDDPPAVGGIPDQTINEGNSFAPIDLAGFLTEVDGDTIIWSSSGSIELSISIVSQVATITVPDEDWSGEETIIFTATDDTLAGLSASDDATLKVTAVNDAPMITSEAWTAANTGIEYRYTATATDVDSDDNLLEWSFEGDKPEGMELVPDTGSSTTITWTPPSSADSSGEITLKVTDGENIDTQIFTIEVTDMPAVIIDQIDQISTTSVSVEASVVAPGIPAATEHGICWGVNEELTVDDDCTEKGPVSAVGPYVTELKGLVQGETYYVRAYAVNTEGAAYSEVVSFQLLYPPRATLSGTPAPLTNATTYSLQVGGIGVVSYQYRLNSDDWSEEQPVNQKIELDVPSEGVYRLQVIGKAESETTGGIWQTDQDATTISWVVDLTPPVAEIVNYPRGTVGPFGGDILVQGEEVVAFHYSLDGDAWSTIYSASVPIVLPDLNDGTHTLAVMGADFAGNWQAEEDAAEIAWEMVAAVPTALLNNLPAAVTNQRFITIGVATPDGGVLVDRYYYRFEGNEGWYRRDAQEFIDVSGLQEGEYTLCVNAGSEDGDWQDGADGTSSTDSATCYEWRIDLTPADPISLMAVNAASPMSEKVALVDSKSVELSWAWTSTDAAETIDHYRVWYSLSSITAETLNAAVEVFCNILPGKEGFEEHLILDGLLPGEQYYFAVTSIDAAGNESGLSNVAALTTKTILPEIHTLEFSQGGLTTDNGAVDELLITGANFLGITSGNLVRFESDITSFELSSRPGRAEETSVDIPLGAPTGTYRVKAINRHGVSLSSDERVVITGTETLLPAVRLLSPMVIAAGTPTWLTIVGDNFNETPAEVNLLDTDGMPLLLTDFTRVDRQTITVRVDVAEDFPEGRYHIQVVNDDGGFNAMSAARLEIGLPMDVNAESGATTTSGILRLKDGLVPAYTFLSSDDGVQNGAPKRNVARIEITLEPGTVFEKQQDDGEWVPYEDAILPPRMMSPAAYTNSGIGDDIIAFSMGASQKLRLPGGARMFVALDITLPSSITVPVVYQAASDGTLSPAGVNGTWRGIEVAVGGTILAERLNVPQTGVTTFTLGILLDHMSDYVIGRQQGAVPLPEPDNMGASDEYGVCFIGAADATPRGNLLCIAVLGLLIVGAVFHFRKLYQRSLVAALMIVALAGFLLTAEAVRAADGVAIEPAAETEEEGIAIPGETETEQEALEVLKDKETGYVPAAASSVRKRARRDDGERRWNIHAGLGYAYIGQEDTATYNGTEVKHELDGDLYPILGVSYAFSTRWALEFSLHRDFYSGSISNSLSGSSSKLEGITANLTTLFLGGPYTWSWIGTYRPYGLAGIGYRTLDGDLDYPVTSYKPAIGAVLGIGMLKGKWDFRLGYSFFKHDADSTQEGYTGSGDELDTSGIYLEVAYHFLKF